MPGPPGTLLGFTCDPWERTQGSSPARGGPTRALAALAFHDGSLRAPPTVAALLPVTGAGVMALRGAPRQRRRTRRIGLLVGASAAALALLVALAIDLLSPGAAAPAPAPVSVAPSQSSIREGPGGRIALTSWAFSPDPGDVGLAQGWSGGGFPGRLVSVPYVPNAAPITGAAGLRNYQGSVAWYRTAFSVARADTYALHFESVNFRATVWLDGHELGPTLAPICPSSSARPSPRATTRWW